MLIASRITPGIASGATLPELRAPALPNEQPRPGSSRSISVTLAPRRSRCQAVQTPTMPAPMTTTSSRSLCVGSVAGTGSVCRHAGVLDHLGPFDHFARYAFRKLLGTRADRIGTFTLDAFPDLRRVQHLHHLMVELGHDVLRRAAGRKRRLPGRHLKIGVSRLRDRRHVRKIRKALGRRDRKRTKRPGPDVLQYRGHETEIDFDVTAEHRIHHLSIALEGNVHEVAARH